MEKEPENQPVEDNITSLLSNDTNKLTNEQNASQSIITKYVTENKTQEENKSSELVANNNIPQSNAVFVEPDAFKRRKIDLYAEDNGPKLYTVKGNLVTPPIIIKNLPEAFSFLPLYGRPKSKANLKEFNMNKIREFVGCNLNDEEFCKLTKYCSPEHLKTGKELVMGSSVPSQTLMPTTVDNEGSKVQDKDKSDGSHLCIRQKNKMRIEREQSNLYQNKLKYRGLRLMPLSQVEDNPKITLGQPLQPGKDLLFRVKVYRPFPFNSRERHSRSRYSVFSCDIVLLGRQKLSTLRDRLICANDVDMRIDVSQNPDELPVSSAKELFPSNFLFINNVFYVDTRDGCIDYSAPIREWAAKRGIGQFEHKDMCNVRLDELVLKLGHPEVYVHQGNCEHVFTFAEARLLGARDPLAVWQYPAHSAAAHHQTVYCTTCAEFGAKWIVVGCSRVPFDPAFFCDTCLKLYLYKDGQKIGDFKAYSYRGNEINMLKPLG